MKSFLLNSGLVVLREDEELRLLDHIRDEFEFESLETGEIISISEEQFWSDYESRQLKIIDSFSSSKEIITFGEVPSILPSENLHNLSEKYLADTVRKMFYIHELKKAGFTRGKKRFLKDEIIRISKQLGDKKPPSPSSIHRWWLTFDDSKSEIHSLISGNANRKRKHKIGRDSEVFLQDQIDACYAVKTRPGKSSAYRGYLEALEIENDRRKTNNQTKLTAVSDTTFIARINRRNKYDLMVARHGKAYADNHLHMTRGHLPADYPLDVVEVDHSLMDIVVLDDEGVVVVGRPWLTVMKDRRTGIIIGFSMSFQKTGIESISECFKHSLGSHLDVQKMWPDIKNPWPAFGFACVYEFDRGSDYLGNQCRDLVGRMGAHYSYCPVHRGDLKGHIERFFGSLNETLFESLPGRTFSNLGKRANYDPSKDTVIKFSTLVHLLHLWICDFHNVLPKDDSQTIPLDLWNEEIKIAPPRYAGNLDDLDILIGMHRTGSLSNEGLRFKWINYANDQLHDLMKRLGKGVKVDFVVNRENLGSIKVKDPNTNIYFDVTSTRPEYAEGLSLFQHEHLRKDGRIRLNKKNAIDELVKNRRAVKKVVSDSIMDKKKFSHSEAARLAGINSNSVLAGNPKTVNNIFANQNLGSEESSAEVITFPAYVRKKLAWGT
ncbi:DDE-type integrase/transposase/recombinase [Polynucleobacter asymbioticus]|jgi:putative transposase|uniref:Integrase catalytic domain-containing protein n=1 Tax=Polynucleobacter asymbioticus TaxID=576611 RepID=A0AAC9IU31_9BURK|nr:DDE-type integrase/transposase/recombinase [Polynucleobacter asymbioticus]APB99649.1 hypothetical protein A4F89_10040 [Polynucleobacter asymbioticus]APC01955.1 hypothetical protein AOC25_10175 [Polynucleobacter asymbioticus]